MGSFKQRIEKERVSQSIRVQPWNRDELIFNLLASDQRPDEEVRDKLTMKRILCVSGGET